MCLSTIVISQENPLLSHFIKVRFAGDKPNRRGFGAKVWVYTNDTVQFQEQNPVRGYFSSVDQDLNFGLNENKKVDFIVIAWLDGSRQTFVDVAADTLLVVSQSDARLLPAEIGKDKNRLFTDITSTVGIVYNHHYLSTNDFALQRLLPQKFSHLGPFITTGDINNDGATDFYVGGTNASRGSFFNSKKTPFLGPLVSMT